MQHRLVKLLGAPAPWLMGVVNVTPDSFTDGGRFLAPDAAAAHGRQLLADGRFRSLQIERVDGVPVADSPHSDALAAAGFQRSYRGWLLRA